MTKIIAAISAFLGISLLLYIFFPILSYELLASSKFATYLTPVPIGDSVISGPVDYTKASNWFIEDDGLNFENESKIKSYTLSIPELNISDMTVNIGGEDLSESLIQYPGTALPGKTGNAVIFGHSILPQFYDPTDYTAIFSTLPSLEKGNQIYIEFDGINYNFVVENMFEVRPTDIEILQQNTDSSYLTLVTCTPPGHPLRPKRLIVRARLVPVGTNIN